MAIKSKNRTIGLLMIISQLLLTGFAIYWLSGQYDREKESLWGDLKSRYNSSYTVTLDSFLVKHYIEPALGDTSVNLYRYTKTTPAFVVADSINVKAFMIDSLEGIRPARGVVTINMKSEIDSVGQSTERDLMELEHQMLLRSVKLIVEHTDDSSGMHVKTRHKINREIDTLLFISTFESGLAEDELKIKPVWIRSGEDSDSKNPDGEIYIGGWIDDVPAVKFEGYRIILLGRIVPQVLFVLVLILLTGFSFLLAYRSLRKQTMLNEMRSSFISNISHELKTPVSTVKVAIEALKNLDLRKESTTATEYLDMSARELKRLERLITRVLDNSIIEHNDSILSFEEVHLAGIIESAIESLEPKVRKAGAVISVQAAADPLINADPFYLQGVIINLLDNSLKYGNGKPEVEISLSAQNNNVVIEVADNGPGIPEQYLKKVFDKFFRIPTSDTHNVKGYGLGLSYASLIVELHGGSIDVKNNEKGCTFTIVIPIKKT